ncbi:hypothetical protein [Sulfuracidifex metallicus]|uniref:MFS transporter n=1 Tax=Sulfuracidifex metallicus DSM 6482 = JCM 9184 TaxID=523847 RepID=A0A6A9QL01_SULME|nr:hypothetical protein [Sulfuracidifex metallicus]MUN29676.1 hypothetical protein [Sulfuracidifex metallicus DSM 6482 = JCM 9184]WOE49817.1 hypothetical protein RQ359_001298 [Sulfuracidifex metallicus DSM 6482 = JCM 9184]
MKVNLPIASSWFLWGASYYLYYPYLSIYLENIIGSGFSLAFVVFTISAIPFSLFGGQIHRRLGVNLSAFIGMVVSGTGLFLIQISSSTFTVILAGIMAYAFFISLPNFYSMMMALDSKCIARIWSLSIVPSLFMPFIGGLISTYYGINWVFILASVLALASSIPILGVHVKPKAKGGKSNVFIPFLSMIPIAIVFPFVYLYLKVHFGFSLEDIGIISTIVEMIGFVTSYLSTRMPNWLALSLYLFIFSLVGGETFFPYFSLSFGLWEAIIPVSLEGSQSYSPEEFGRVNAFQQIGWLVGFVISYLAGSTSLIVSSLFSALVMFYVLLSHLRAIKRSIYPF